MQRTINFQMKRFQHLILQLPFFVISRAMVHHIPTDEDIAELLTEFTVDFLLKGFSNLVSTARKNILLSETSQNLHMEQSHYLWLVTYFLKFSAQLEVELEQVG